MLDIKYIRENPDKVQQGAENKGVKVDIARLLELDKNRREILAQTEQIKAKRNELSEVVSLSNHRDQNIDDRVKSQARELKEKIQAGESRLRQAEEEFNKLMHQIPNVPFDGVPVGKDDSENKVKELGKIKEKPKFDFKPKEHWEIGGQLDIIDIERASKVAGSRFYYLKKQGALLEFSLINFAFEKVTAKGFVPVIPPVMIKPEMAWALGFLQQTDDEEAYHLEKDNLYLTATAEQGLGAMHAGETFDEKDLPLRYVGFSTCFRREAGSFGKDTKGMLRAHQFDKIEMFIFCKPEDSKKEHELLLSIEKELMDDLGLHYQVVDICTGDLGVPAAKKYDIETWMPGQNRYRETHSTSNCTDFQARRLNTRYRDKKGSMNFVHTLNGTAFSMRPIIAILENFQQKDGSIEVPKVLQKYFGLKEIKK
ncbi:MAG: serine--tRNA ligase [Patescibacteria group bacterium]|nr:serine--tRNA ligase [Patescibacteria group bacterium]